MELEQFIAWSIDRREVAIDAGDDRLPPVRSGVRVVTCARLEHYGFERSFDMTRPAVRHRVRRGQAAVAHLFRVAGGLESPLVGEHQILGQLRDAADEACAAGRLDDDLARLFRSALRAGRRVRGETALGALAGSYGRLAAARAAAAGERIGIAGTGSLARGVLRALAEIGAAPCRVFGRHPERMADEAARVGAVTAPLADVFAALAHLDVLVTALSVPELLRVEHWPMAAGPVLIDLGRPPNVEQRLAARADVCYLGLSDLEADGEGPARTIAEARVHVAAAVDAFLTALRRGACPAPRPWRVRARAGTAA